MINKNQDRVKLNMALWRYLHKVNNSLTKAKIMRDYSSIMEVLKDLNRRGFSNYFYLNANSIECAKLRLHLDPHDFEIIEVYRFQSGSTFDYNPVFYDIESKVGIKGVLVDALGTCAKSKHLEIATKLGRAVGLKNKSDGNKY